MKGVVVKTVGSVSQIGFLETNQILTVGGERYVFYGDTPDELYAQHRMSRVWVALDRPSPSVLETFPSFDAMFAKVLRDALWGLKP